MRVGVSLPVNTSRTGYTAEAARLAMLQEALDGRLGDWLRLHSLFEEAQIWKLAMFIVFDCDESQYLECLLGFDGTYIVEIITR